MSNRESVSFSRLLLLHSEIIFSSKFRLLAIPVSASVMDIVFNRLSIETILFITQTNTRKEAKKIEAIKIFRYWLLLIY